VKSATRCGLSFRVRSERERGQATPEWVALVLLAALAFATVAAAGVPVPGADLARSIAARLACAAGLGEECAAGRGDLTLAYGAELAAAVSEHAPRLEYEEGMRALPVDFRSCREDACAEGAESGPVTASRDGEPVTAFVHVIDCRDPGEARREDYECAGDRRGRIYLQYWLYYPGSATARALIGDAGAHPDDWESFQIRLGPDGTVEARASSHHGYNGDSGDWLSDSGLVEKAGWTESTGRYAISGGSHAGRIGENPPPGRRLRLPFGGRRRAHRWTEPAAIRIIPIEPLASGGERWEFAVSPPWAKRVYRDPEYRGTD
jgi:hypothetical protein